VGVVIGLIWLGWSSMMFLILRFSVRMCLVVCIVLLW